MKSCPFGSCPNLELWHDHRTLKTHIQHYDIICPYIENTYTTLWHHTIYAAYAKCRKILQEKGLQI